MAGIGTRFTIERVMIGNYLPKVARACALLDPFLFSILATESPRSLMGGAEASLIEGDY